MTRGGGGRHVRLPLLDPLLTATASCLGGFYVDHGNHSVSGRGGGRDSGRQTFFVSRARVRFVFIFVAFYFGTRRHPRSTVAVSVSGACARVGCSVAGVRAAASSLRAITPAAAAVRLSDGDVYVRSRIRTRPDAIVGTRGRLRSEFLAAVRTHANHPLPTHNIE